AALLYPGLCLLEGTEISEGRGTARPFELAGAPGVDVAALLSALEQRQLPGLALLPSWFRPQFWKHAGAVCAGLQAVVTDAGALRPLRFGLELLAAFHAVAPEAF